jgi:hypothetical protein
MTLAGKLSCAGQALCRTRTDDPFLTMEDPAASRASWESRTSRTRAESGGHGRAPAGARRHDGVPGEFPDAAEAAAPAPPLHGGLQNRNARFDSWVPRSHDHGDPPALTGVERRPADRPPASEGVIARPDPAQFVHTHVHTGWGEGPRGARGAACRDEASPAQVRLPPPEDQSLAGALRPPRHPERSRVIPRGPEPHSHREAPAAGPTDGLQMGSSLPREADRG